MIHFNKRVKKIMLATFAVVAICFNFTSCTKTCVCNDRNTGYIYPEIDYKAEGYKNCKALQKDMNMGGVAVYCERGGLLY